jgi:polar amino acid transport system substrate-binding protein
VLHEKYWRWLKIAFLIMCTLFICSCSSTNTSALKITKLQDLNQGSIRVGLMQGSASEIKGRDYFSHAKLSFFITPADALVALREHKIDAVAFDKDILKQAAKNMPEVMFIPQSYASYDISVGVNKEDGQLLQQVNGALKSLQDDGTIKAMEKRWLEDDSTEIPAGLEDKNQGTPVLTIGTSGTVPPWSFIAHNKLTGFDAELGFRLGKILGRKVVFKIMEYDALVAALETHKIDLILANLNMTEERAKKIAFSNKYHVSDADVVILKSAWGGAKPEELEIKTLAAANGKPIGVVTGSISDQVAKKVLPKSTCSYYNTYSDCVLAVKNGKVGGFICDEPIARAIVVANPDLGYIKEPLEKDVYGIGISKNRMELKTILDKGLAEYKKNGTLKKIDNIWFGNDEAAKIMPAAKPGTKGNVICAVSADSPPMVYMKNKEYVGYEVALITSIMQDAGYSVTFQDMEFTAIMPALVSGKADLACSAMTITEERQKSITFSDSDYEGGIVLVVRNKANAAGAGGFWQEIKTSFYRNFIYEDRYEMVIRGLKTTIAITLGAALFGTILGLGVCFLKRSSKKWLSVPTNVFISIMQGTPLVVFLMIMYYIVFGGWDINPLYVAIIAFGINFATAVGSMVSTGIDTVDKGQMEAATAMGFTKVQGFMKIVTPQALRYVLPVYAGEFISLLKMTSVVGYIAIQDLTKMSDIIRSRTYEAFFPLIATAVIYFLTAWILTSFLTYLQYKMDPKKRARTLKGVRL